MHENNLDGVILVPGPNLRYYTGRISVESILLERIFLLFVPKEEPPNLLAPDFELGPYRDCPIQMKLHGWQDNEGPSHALEDLVREMELKGSWGMEGRVPFRFIHILTKYAKPKLEDGESILQTIREIKEEEEIQLLKKAASILSRSFLKIPTLLERDMSEQQLARRLSEQIYSEGAESVFVVLVQAGERGADPHCLPSARKIAEGEGIVIDAACTFAGYYADITRTVILGKNKRFEELYAHVLEAQEKAIRASRPGIEVGSIDQAARDRLKENDLGRYFMTRTGHGLGLEVHEPPYIVSNGDEILQPSMVFTIEPGVYIPRELALRIEDDVLTLTHDHEVLTSELPKEFGWWR